MTTSKLYTPTFITLCISYAFFGGSFNMIIPELPSYLENLGGADYKGLIIALFTLTAGLSRPFSGKLTDTVGRKPIIIFGALVCIVCSLIYPILTGVSGFLWLRLAHGFSTGFNPTAVTTYIADIVPEHRRGEAMGIIGVSFNLGTSATPPLGSYLTNAYSIELMFVASSIMALLSLLLVFRLPETLAERQSFSPSLLLIRRNEWFSGAALYPAIVGALCYLGYGAVITVTPDQCEHLGIQNKGIFFTSFTLCAILSRMFSGRLSDRYGRLIVIRGAVMMISVSYLLFAYSDSPLWLIATSGMLGYSIGMAIPAVMAWTVDIGSEHTRGKDLATFFIGLEFAIGFGALLGAWVYDNSPAHFKMVFIIISGISILGLLFCKDLPGKRNKLSQKGRES